MPFRVIAGSVHIQYPDRPRVGPEPDGDTVSFVPDERATLAELNLTAGVGAAFNSRGMVNVRLEGIDALELHYEESHQEMEGSAAARDALLELLGFGTVTYFANSPLKVESVQRHPRRAHLLARSIDRYGRIIAFLVPGDAAETDGAAVHLDAARVDRSVNARLLRQGHVYPAFYTSLPVDLRQHLAGIAVAARAAQSGVWPRDTASLARAARITTLADAEALVLWPKLFRRLAAYFLKGRTGLGGFVSWLRSGNDDKLILPQLELGNMHDVIAITGDEIRLKYLPEEIVLVDNDVAEAVELPPAPPAQRHDVRIVGAVANPVETDPAGETVTLLNTTPIELELTNWSLVDRSGDRLELAGRLRPGDTRRINMRDKLRLANTGDSIELFSPEGVAIDRVEYTAADAANKGRTIVF